MNSRAAVGVGRRRPIFRYPTAPAAAWLVAAVTGCGGAESGVPEPETYVIHDSTGIEIVENTLPSWEADEGWSIAETPSLVLGNGRGDSEGLLFEVSGATRMADGRVAVADGGSHLVKLFSPIGELVRSFGGEGEGPGEFRALDGVFRYGADTLGTYDSALSRAQLFTQGGGLVRSIAIPPPESYRVSELLPLADGTFLLTQDRVTSGFAELGLFRHEMPYLRLAPDGSILATLGPFEGTTVFSSADAVGTSSLGARSQAATAGDLVIVGEAHGFEVRAFTLNGALTRIVRWTGRSQPVTPELIDAHLDVLFDAMDFPEDARGPAREALRGNPFPEQLPPYQDLVGGASGELWVMEHLGPLGTFRSEWTGVVMTWQVFDPRGRWLGAVQTPEGLELLEVGDRYVLGVHRDELGVETVRLHELRKPSTGALSVVSAGRRP